MEEQTTQPERKTGECGFIDIVQYNPQPVDDPKPELSDEDWEGTYKGKLFEQIYKRKCDYSQDDYYKMSLIQKQINIMIQDLLNVNPEAAKALAEMANGEPYQKIEQPYVVISDNR